MHIDLYCNEINGNLGVLDFKLQTASSIHVILKVMIYCALHPSGSKIRRIPLGCFCKTYSSHGIHRALS